MEYNTAMPFKKCLTRRQVLVGLSAALLSDENHTLRKETYRPVNLRKIMATLVIQRALKRNMMIKQRRFDLADVVLAAEANAGTGALPNTIPHVAGLGVLHKHHVDGNFSRTSAGHHGNFSRARASRRLPQRWENIDWTCGNNNDLTGNQAMGQYPQVFGAGEVGGAGSIGLPPSTEESTWLLRRFLLELQETNGVDDVVDEVEALVARDQDPRQTAVTSATTGVRSPRADTFFTSRSKSTKGTEAGFPDAAEQGRTLEGRARENASKRDCEGQRGSSDRPHTSSANSGCLGAVAGNGYHSPGEGPGIETEGGRETSGSSSVGWLRSKGTQAWTTGKCLAEVKDSERNGIQSGQSGSVDEERGMMEREDSAQEDEPDELPMTSLAVWLKGRGRAP